MSELIQKHDSRATIRWKLLTGASALVLTAYVSAASLANAEDSDRPQIWIELGGQFSRLQDAQEIFAPPFVALTPPDFTPPQKFEKPPIYGLDETAALTFQPEGSDWIFSASLRYGRASNSRHSRQQSNPAPYIGYLRIHRSRNGHVRDFTNYYTKYALSPRAVDVTARQNETHTILDFQAGKDWGIGLFGHGSSSTLNFGVRFAQFKSKSRIDLAENPDWQFQTQLTHFSTSYSYGSSHYSLHRTRQAVYQPFHSFAGAFRANRSFKGLGPSVSWKSSLPFAGNQQDGGLTFDWGVNAALLFGRQKTKTQHHTTGRFHSSYAPGTSLPVTYQHPATPDRARSRNVIVPNVGGFAGVSFNYADAKVSFGYKADFFFGAIDGGIDARKNENRGFYGPYASISIGLGD